MSKQVLEQPEDEKQDAKQRAKKLSRREHRLQKRLEEAQERYESALVRLQHAEQRLQKRLERVERLNGRLVIVRQQLEASIDSQSRTLTDSELKQDTVQLEIPSLPPESGDAAQEVADPEDLLISPPVAVISPLALVPEAVPATEPIEPERLSEVGYEPEETPQVYAPANVQLL